MSDLGLDLNRVFGSQETAKVASNSTNKKAGSDMVMDDFLKLMVAQFQNQSIDNTADTTEMMNQMVQMSVIQAITNLSTLVTDSTNLSYAASLVGKQVTLGEHTDKNNIDPIFGTVTGTGMLDGKQVVFLDNKDTPYDISDILAVGSIPQSIPKSAADLLTTNTDNTSAAGASGTEWYTTAQTDTANDAASGERDPHTPDEDGALG
jgi:flagellar basal-body rod modification protein FlgD